MSNKPTPASASKSKKSGLKHGFSLYTKIILTLLLLLALAAAAFVYNAWRQLTLSNATDPNLPALSASVEMLTPAGSKITTNQAVYTPPVQTASTAANERDTTVMASDSDDNSSDNNDNSAKPKIKTVETPVIPVNTAPANPTPDNTTAVTDQNNNTLRPVNPTSSPKTHDNRNNNSNKELDNLF